MSLLKAFHLIQILVAISIIYIISSKASTEKPFYTAAVFEYHSIKKGDNLLEIANRNADVFLYVINKAVNYSVDIIVFPESGISRIFKNKSVAETFAAATFIPNPDDKINLCTSDDDNYQLYLKKISCAAQNAAIYVVINVHEKHLCNGTKNCPPDGIQIFNTNVVFNRQGRIISIYRKYNLFVFELGKISRPELALSTFKTDFNVTFGQFICFDVLFKSPALDLVVTKNITDFVFPTFWSAELPFLTATQAQLGFSYANDVNFLAANLNLPRASSVGSGIYAGVNGPLVVFDVQQNRNILLVANVPKFVESGKRHKGVDVNPVVYEFSEEEIPIDSNDGDMAWSYNNFDNYTTKPYDPENFKSFNESICNGGLCCNFRIESVLNNHNNIENQYRYRIVAFKGLKYHGPYIAGVEICSIVACKNDTLESCGYIIKENVHQPLTFTKIVITRTIDEKRLYFTPSVYTTGLTLLETNSFSYTQERKDKHEIELKLTKPRNDLFVFAIFGRDENHDQIFNISHRIKL